MKLIPTSIQPVTITLYRGIPFDNNYNEHTFLSNKFRLRAGGVGSIVHNVGTNKESFINIRNNGEYIYPRTTKSGTFNFAFGNGLVTSVVMELTGNEINSNYMKVVSGEDVYYYFITGITQKNDITYLLNLELDVIMTYTDEFLDNMNNKPVMVERKDCRRVLRRRVGNNWYSRVNPVCFNQESTFNKLKSNIIKSMTPLEFKDFVNGTNDFNDLMAGLNWIYIILGKNGGVSYSYKENGVTYPYGIVCIPTKTIQLNNILENPFDEQSGTPFIIDAWGELDNFVGNPAVQKIIISPFPPFKICSNITMVFNSNTKIYEITLGSYGYIPENNYISFYSGSSNTGSLLGGIVRIKQSDRKYGYLMIQEGFGGNFEYNYDTPLFTKDIMDIDEDYDEGEYKLGIAPFRDIRMSSYYGGENHLNIQYLLLNESSGVHWGKMRLYTIASTNAESNSYYDFADLGNYDIAGKRGISNSVAYTLPTGTDAELLYNQTSKNQYENSKTIGAITNGLKIVGGGLALALAPSVTAKMAGGLAVASGVTGEIENFTSWSAKMEDLQNTPNSYNFAGSSYAYDMAISESDANGTLLPYLIQYGVNDIEYKMGAEFMYNYGYEYNAESYFNTMMTHNDDSIFNRQLFNYVKIREDITTKVVGDNLPLIVAKKFNEILNAGIKLWTFFDCLFDKDMVDDYFQKTRYCNAEMVVDNLRGE